MNANVCILRPITPEDNAPLAALILRVLTEFGCVGPGFASSDPELHDLYQVYRTLPGESLTQAYWVIADADNRQVLGGGGFARLKGADETDAICELQKLYFDPILRGQGWGKRLLQQCLGQAAAAGYRAIYLETAPQMAGAVSLYEQLGFRPLPHALGRTGHHACTVFMSRPLQKEDAVSPRHRNPASSA